MELKFNRNGLFKIVQFTDSQDGPNTDLRTLDLINRILDKEKPNLVVLTGDNIDGKCKSKADVKKAITNIVMPMENRNIPWTAIFGNHDDEHKKMNKEEMMKFYMTFKHSLCQVGYKILDRIGNYNLLINGARNNKPAFNIYLLDSGKKAPCFFHGYNWIKLAQIHWYKQTALKLKEKYEKTIPAIMFFHIPFPEFKIAWKTGLIEGERNESESCPRVNSGLFDVLVKTGDVKGVFVGHDHVNNYCAELEGIRLGYAGNIGYGTYGKKDFKRGARVFLIEESDCSNYKTWITNG